jgi:hypothetical protein
VSPVSLVGDDRKDFISRNATQKVLFVYRRSEIDPFSIRNMLDKMTTTHLPSLSFSSYRARSGGTYPWMINNTSVKLEKQSQIDGQLESMKILRKEEVSSRREV